MVNGVGSNYAPDYNTGSTQTASYQAEDTSNVPTFEIKSSDEGTDFNSNIFRDSASSYAKDTSSQENCFKTEIPQNNCETKQPDTSYEVEQPQTEYETETPSTECETEQPPTECETEKPPTECETEQPPTECETEKPPTECKPEVPPTKCETPPTECKPEQPPVECKPPEKDVTPPPAPTPPAPTPPVADTPPPAATPPAAPPVAETPPVEEAPPEEEAPPAAPPVKKAPPTHETTGGSILGDPQVFDEDGNMMATFSHDQEKLWDSGQHTIISTQQRSAKADELQKQLNTNQTESLQLQLQDLEVQRKGLLQGRESTTEVNQQITALKDKLTKLGGSFVIPDNLVADPARAQRVAELATLAKDIETELADQVTIKSVTVTDKTDPSKNEEFVATAENVGKTKTWTETGKNGTVVTMTATVRDTANGPAIEFGNKAKENEEWITAKYISLNADGTKAEAADGELNDAEKNNLIAEFGENGATNSLFLSMMTNEFDLISQGKFEFKPTTTGSTVV